jgi:AcrR family transcriptional regulator
MPSPASGLKTRQALLDVAKSFLGQGNTDVSIQEIARAAEVSVGSVYTYFADKGDLFEIAANEALLESYGPLQEIASGVEDTALGFIAACLYACRRPEFDPETARIIVTMGPVGFARFNEYLAAPTAAVQESIDHGTAHFDDVEAFVTAISGAYQNVLAHYFVGTAAPDLGERVMWLFAEQLGYTREEYAEVVNYVNARMKQ